MKMWRPVLVLVLFFGAGVAAGVFGTRLAERQEAWQLSKHPDRPQQQLERALIRRLELDPEQQEKLHDIVTRSRKQLETVYQQVQPEAVTIRRAMDGEIMAMLTPAQRDLYRKFKQQNHPLWKPLQSHPAGGKTMTNTPP